MFHVSYMYIRRLEISQALLSTFVSTSDSYWMPVRREFEPQ